MNKKVRFAIIGCGMIADFHARAIGEVSDAELVGVYGPIREQAVVFSDKYHTRMFESYEEVLMSDDVDVVSLCTPSGLHASQAIEAIEHKKHVVAEKPMALKREDAQSIIDASVRTGVKVCVISQLRFSPEVQLVKREIEKGTLGKIVSASLSMKYFRSVEYYKSSEWRGTWAMDGGGALMNQGIHGVDILQYLMGGVSWVMATMSTMTRPIETEDMVAAIMEFKNGALGTMQASTTCYPGYPRRIEICGDQGSIVLEEDRILNWDLSSPFPKSKEASESLHAVADPKNISVEGHRLQFANMTRAILQGETPLVDAVEGKKAVDIILAVYDSARTGKKLFL